MTVPAIAPVPFVLGVRCTNCSRFYSIRDLIKLPGNVHICRKCYEHHLEALHAMQTGDPPRNCHECGISVYQLAELSRDGNTGTRMFLHQKDGVYQLLCPPCSDKYERKRLDLYGDTAYGWTKKLKGAK